MVRIQNTYSWVGYPLVFFFAAFTPLPNQVVIIPLALLGYRFVSIFALVFAGKLLFNTLAALGVIHILNIL